MSIPSGKGIMIWNLGDCGWDDHLQMASDLADAGIEHVTVKALDGTSETWGNFVPRNKDLLPGFMAACRAFGIKIGVYQYIYGGTPWIAASEGDVAREWCEQHQPDFFVIDVEHQYKALGAAVWAQSYLSQLTIEVPIGLCSYRYPSLHPEIPWSVFLSYVDFHMPQVYWAGSNSVTAPAVQLAQSRQELMSLRALPFVPVGAAYQEWGWTSTPAQVQNFSDAAQAMGLPGISFWDLKHARQIQGMWSRIIDLDWGTPPDPEPDPDPDPVPPTQAVVKAVALNIRHRPVYGSLKVGMMKTGDVVRVYDQHAESNGDLWLLVRDGYDITGWAAMRYAGNVFMEWLP